MRIITAIFALAAMLSASLAAAAQEPNDETRKVVVSPFVYARTDGSALTPAQVRDSVTDGLEGYVHSAHDPFVLAPMADVLEQIQADETYPQLVEVATEWAEIGFGKYRELDPGGAAESLARAYSQYRQAGHEFVAPQEVAEVLLFLALAALERGGDVVGPLEVMKEMVQLDPSREVNRGEFPDEVVDFYDSARLALERDVRERGPDGNLARRLAKRAEADHVLMATVIPNPDRSVDLVVWRYDVRDDRFGLSETLQVSEPTKERLTSAANRLASRLVTCLAPAEDADVTAPARPSSGDAPLALQLSFAYASYLQFQDVAGRPVEPFDHLGASIGATFKLTREFALLVMFQFLTSTDEYSGLVQPGFTTLRSFAGGELGVDVGPMTLALGTMFEGTAVSSIVLCPGREKARDGVCDDRVVLDPQFLFGVSARPRLGLQLLPSLQLFVTGSTSFFFVPLTEGELNFLTALETGLQYRF